MIIVCFTFLTVGLCAFKIEGTLSLLLVVIQGPSKQKDKNSSTYDG